MNDNTGSTAGRRAGTALALAAALLLTACASSAPVVYSKRTDSVATDPRVQADIEQCSRQADERVGRNAAKSRRGAEKVASAGAIGFVATAVGSTVAKSKDVWQRARGAAAGGASGLATKLLLEWNEGDDVYQGYVERCLERRGHEVLGWR